MPSPAAAPVTKIPFLPDDFQLSELKGYLLNIKTLVSLLAVSYVLYAAFTDIPTKFGLYTAAMGQKGNLLNQKNSVKTEENRLKLIAQELSKLETKPLKLEVGSSPEIACLGLTQKIIDLSESLNNQYIKLTPAGTEVINVDGSVTLPVNLAAASPGAAPPPPPAAGAPAAPAAPAPPPAPGGATTSAELKANKYTMELKGTYLSLINFIHDLATLQEFVLIEKISLLPAAGGIAYQVDRFGRDVVAYEFLAQADPKTAAPTTAPAGGAAPAPATPTAGNKTTPAGPATQGGAPPAAGATKPPVDAKPVSTPVIDDPKAQKVTLTINFAIPWSY